MTKRGQEWWQRKPIRLASVAVVLFLGGMVGHSLSISPRAYMLYQNLSPGPSQPIPFSHRVHVATKQIGCAFCHPYADRGPNAGIPPVEKCLLCHNVIATRFPPIQAIRGYYDRGEPIPWVRVNRVADHCFFNHQVHVLRGFDCGECHGDVRVMDRIKPRQKIHMGWCVDCHRQNAGSVDCLACHR